MLSHMKAILDKQLGVELRAEYKKSFGKKTVFYTTGEVRDWEEGVYASDYKPAAKTKRILDRIQEQMDVYNKTIG